MFGDLKEILSKLNSASDWAVVGTAAVVGFTLDAAINIVPLPLFSPGVCGATAAGSALSAKRSWEAWRELSRTRKLIDLYANEGERLAQRREQSGALEAAQELRIQIVAAQIQCDPLALKAAIEKAYQSQ